MMQINKILIIISLVFLISMESTFILEIYGVEDLVVNEKVHITMSKNNETLIVPAKIGIDPTLWKNHSLDHYSFDPNNNSPLNTKTYDGIIHIESIYDREFTLDNFLDVWGFDKSNIQNIFCDTGKVCFSNVTLTDDQDIKLELKNDNSQKNFTRYEDAKISLEYPSKWNFSIVSNLPKGNENASLSSKGTFYYVIKLAPKEFEYMQTPLFSIQINKIDPNMTYLDEFYKNNLYTLLEANENTFPHFINYNMTMIDGNLAYQIFLNTTLVAEPGSSAIGNKVTQKGFHIWTTKDGYFYDISFEAFDSVYKKYGDIKDTITRSIHIK